MIHLLLFLSVYCYRLSISAFRIQVGALRTDLLMKISNKYNVKVCRSEITHYSFKLYTCMSHSHLDTDIFVNCLLSCLADGRSVVVAFDM